MYERRLVTTIFSRPYLIVAGIGRNIVGTRQPRGFRSAYYIAQRYMLHDQYNSKRTIDVGTSLTVYPLAMFKDCGG
jgi:hypothetical protein